MNLRFINKIKFLLKILKWNLINFQDFNSYSIILIIEFHDLILIILLIIIIFILYIIIWFIQNKFFNKIILHNQIIEIIWTIIPIIILILIIIPSLKILYIIEELINPYITIKIIGHQWYWSYEYSDFKNIKFDSFIYLNFNKLNIFRLLDVDNRLILPNKLNIRFLISSIDVIHSWTIPVLGIKVDAIPGRLNQISIYINRLGIFFGQCSEICGLNHSFIPIVLERINVNKFIQWLKNI